MCRIMIHVGGIFESNGYNIYNTCISCIEYGFTLLGLEPAVSDILTLAHPSFALQALTIYTAVGKSLEPSERMKGETRSKQASIGGSQ